VGGCSHRLHCRGASVAEVTRPAVRCRRDRRARFLGRGSALGPRSSDVSGDAKRRTAPPAAVEGVPEPKLIGEAEALPLPPTATVAPVSTIFTLKETRREPFGVGSTREEVIAAQGREPTYASKDRRILWWGSAKVRFTPEGRVNDWLQGQPQRLNVFDGDTSLTDLPRSKGRDVGAIR